MKNLSNLNVLNILKNDNLYNSLPDCLNETTTMFDPFFDVVNFYSQIIDNNKKPNEKFIIDNTDIDIKFTNKESLYFYVKNRVIYNNEHYIFTFKKGKNKISIIMHSIDKIVDCIIEHYIKYI